MAEYVHQTSPITELIDSKVIETRRGRLFFRKKSLEAIAAAYGLEINTMTERQRLNFEGDCISVAGFEIDDLHTKEYYLDY